ncbi:MAG: type IV secretory system conjugative DNA transfer family protein [Rhodospirillales bacterium]|nr:type IV secretory system conjugative DNA transfer family protein [Alphaproteobacteria bacterium]MCB9986574.1 type IV secretory system conjugative DNA transfer family protein [Rhodospirillales bacterium]USO06894.1 MAG: type IV secretory system conjugative DNA transfer family protein [Rhodospirillales bacterium]
MNPIVVRTAFCLIALLAAGAPVAARAEAIPQPGIVDILDQSIGKAPPSLEELQIIPANAGAAVKADTNPEIRNEGLADAATSYGARGGLAWRTYQIRATLDDRASYLDKIYDFKRLLITAPSGLLIEPPIISEAEDAMVIEGGGQSAAVADKIYNINVNAQIVAVARNWRAYLEREWGDVTPPPSVLYPTTPAERTVWFTNLRKGWDEGIKQADEVFQADLDRLNADFRGMIRYRMLLAQGIVSPPFTLQTDRGVTGGGAEMRVGDRALQITGPSELQPRPYEWQPASR